MSDPGYFGKGSLLQAFSRIIGVTFLVCVGAIESNAEVRTWTDSAGKFSVDAEFVELTKDLVVLRRETGKEISVPLSKLSKADQSYVRSQKKPSRPAVRVWTDSTGKNTVKATLVELEGTEVQLLRLDGKTIAIDLKKLSAADQSYVKQQSESTEKARESTESLDPVVKEFLEQIQSDAAAANDKISAAREKLKQLHEEEILVASGKVAREKAEQEDAKEKEEQRRSLAQYALPYFRSDPAVVRVETMQLGQSIVLGTYRGNGKSIASFFMNGSLTPQPDGLTSFHLPMIQFREMGKTSSITRDEVLKLLNNPRVAKKGAPDVKARNLISKRHRSELAPFDKARRLVTNATTETRKAVLAIDNGPTVGDRKLLLEEVEKLQGSLAKQLDEALAGIVKKEEAEGL
ncbi:MAG: hypothetical protein H8E66_19510 [Planctomycetes bacterium]|nr:hypothetical protein [Planctomycetota bacterium]